MSEQKERLIALVDNVKDYLNIRIQLLALSFCERTARVLAWLIANAAMLFFIALFLLFGSIAAALGIGEWLDSSALGFAIVAGFYLLLALIIRLIKAKYIQKPLISTFIKAFLKSTVNTEADEKD